MHMRARLAINEQRSFSDVAKYYIYIYIYIYIYNNKIYIWYAQKSLCARAETSTRIFVYLRQNILVAEIFSIYRVRLL